MYIYDKTYEGCRVRAKASEIYSLGAILQKGRHSATLVRICMHVCMHGWMEHYLAELLLSKFPGQPAADRHT